MVMWGTGYLSDPFDLNPCSEVLLDEFECIVGRASPIDDNNEEEKNMFILPVLLGDKVILNPDGENYRSYNREQARNTSGIVISTRGIRTEDWSNYSRNEINGIAVDIKWECGNQNSYRLRDLLPLASDDEGIEFYEFDGGAALYGKYQDIEQDVDKYVILKGREISSHIKINKQYRNEQYDKLAYKIAKTMKSGKTLSAHQMEMVEALAMQGIGIDVDAVEVKDAKVESGKASSRILEHLGIVARQPD